MKVILIASILICTNTLFAQDTINRLDPASRKFGYWKIYGNDKAWQGKGYASNAVAEEGRYFEGKKTGIWKTWYPSGKLKREVEHKNGRPSGKFVTYYENGCKEEEGTWHNNAYQGDYKRYAEDSCGKVIKQKTYNEKGKTEGRKTYPIINEGPELNYNSKPDTLKKYAPQTTVPQKNETVSQCDPMNVPGIKDGYQKIYTSDKNLCLDGEFKNGKLYNGKHYIYDKNGLIAKIKIYKNGKYFADGLLD